MLAAMPKASIVIHTLNVGRFIGPTLDALMQQSFEDCELVVVESNFRVVAVPA